VLNLFNIFNVNPNRMKNTNHFSAIKIVATLACHLFAGTVLAAECSKAITSAETAWYDSLKAADGKALNKLLANDFAYQHPTGNTYDKKAVVDLFVSKKVTVTKVGSVARSCKMFGNTVVASGSNTIEGVLAGQPYAGTMRYVDVWHKSNGAWQLTHRNSEILAPN
jgi:ketosteroid isomerase-like protein